MVKIKYVLLLLLILQMEIFAAIRIRIADEDMIEKSPNQGTATTNCGIDTNYCCSSWATAQWRYPGFKCLRDDLTPNIKGCVSNINFSKFPFSEGVSKSFFPPYVVYGEADRFVVPQSGNYVFWAKYDLFTFIIIDNQILKNGLNVSRDTIKMYRAPFPIVGKSLISDRNAYRTEIYLDQGDHTFQIFYSASADLLMSRCDILWLRPNSFDFEIIPSYVFGNPDNCFPNNKVSLNRVRKESNSRNAISYKDNMLNIIGSSSKIYTLKITI